MDLDITMYDGENFQHDEGNVPNFIVAVDFGTTFSSVCYFTYTNLAQRRRMEHLHIDTVSQFPNQPYNHIPPDDVPTEIWYEGDTARQAVNLREEGYEEDDSSEDSSVSSDDGERRLQVTPQVSFSLLKKRSAPVPPGSVHWGYGVQEKLSDLNSESNQLKHLTRFKLMLSEREEAAPVRNRVLETCQTLKKLNIIREDIDVIADYLEQLFRATKQALVDHAGYTDESLVEFVLCVPVLWKSRACRDMQIAMTNAIKYSGLGKLRDDMVDNLFIVSEPEAAATCVVEENNVQICSNDTFVILDAGGGTVDTVTYVVRGDDPLRLKAEVVKPDARLCGSSFINERYQNLLVAKLQDEYYLDANGRTRSQIINNLVVNFERRDKERMDIMLEERSEKYVTVKIPGLRADKRLRFLDGHMRLKLSEVEALFRPSAQGIAELMHDQIRKAHDKGHGIKKVILVGGFGKSRYLKAFLRESLKTLHGSRFNAVGLVVAKPRTASSAVAKGAVMRALRKEQGPERILQSSYGLLRSEQFGTEIEHIGQPVYIGQDRLQYIDNTIDWLIHKGDILQSEWRVSIPVYQTFGRRKEKLICPVQIYVSDENHESHYRWNHAKNDGAETAGLIEVDMTFLKSEPTTLVNPHIQGVFPYWRVDFTLVIIGNGRNLRYEARWPDQHGTLRKAGGISLASAFQPGTA